MFVCSAIRCGWSARDRAQRSCDLGRARARAVSSSPSTRLSVQWRNVQSYVTTGIGVFAQCAVQIL